MAKKSKAPKNTHGAKALAHEDVPQPGHPSLSLGANDSSTDQYNKPFPNKTVTLGEQQ